MQLSLYAALRAAQLWLPVLLVVAVVLRLVPPATHRATLAAAVTFVALHALERTRLRFLLPTVLLPVIGGLIFATGGSASPFGVFLAVHMVSAAVRGSTRRYVIEVLLAVGVGALPLLYEQTPQGGFDAVVVLGAAIMAGTTAHLHVTWRHLLRLQHTERERARDQSEREQAFRSLFEHNSDPVVAVDRDGLFTRVNRAGAALLGRSENALAGQPFQRFLDPQSVDVVTKAFESALDGEPQRYDAVVVAPSGRRTVVEASTAPIVVDGTVVGVFTVCKDVTPLREAQDELRRKEAEAVRLLQQQSLALAAGRMAVWELDLRTDTLRWHEIPDGGETERLRRFAATRHAFEWVAMIHPDDVEAFWMAREMSLATGNDFSAEFRVILGEGEVAWVASSARLVWPDGADAPAGFYGVVVDITERRAAEEELRVREEQLRQAQQLEALGQLAGGIAHDFNNMLTAILGFSELLEIQLGEDPNVAHIRQAGERARDLVRQLLAFSRRPERTGVVDVSTGIDGVVALIGRLIGDHITLHTQIDGDLGAVRLDGAQLEQIVLNLAVNARDAMPAGGELRLGASLIDVPEAEAAGQGLEPGRYVRLLVGDTGSGMRPEVVPHVFEPFYTTKPEGQGTGMGLATVYGIVTGASGRIAIDTAPGQGTTFVVDLPLAAEAAQPRESEPLAELDRSASGTVLLVEDQGQIRGLVRQALVRRGYRVLSAPDGQAALDVARDHRGRVDLLLTDVVMPNLNGVDLADRLRQENPRLRVLFMSGYARGEAFGTSVPMPEGTAFIQKPFGLGALLSDVESLLQGHSQAA